MAIIQGNAKGGGGFYPKELEQSLRFNDDDSAHLSWTPASAGNMKTWTFSTWFKRGDTVSNIAFLNAGNAITSYLTISLDINNKLVIYGRTNTVDSIYADMPDLIRDHSAWYHLVVTLDTTQATGSDRVKMYLNGVEKTLTFYTTPTLNSDNYINFTELHTIGRQSATSSNYFDGYLSEVHFVDGQALDATSFGEFKNGVWVPKDVDVTYGTNGFYLPFRNDYTVEGMSTVTYRGNGSTQYIGGVGFEPDLVWIKSRVEGATNYAGNHLLFDSIRGVHEYLISNATDAEPTTGSKVDTLQSFDADGFSVGTRIDVNRSTDSYVAWCWDAGTGSPASNTDGSITSTVKANPAYGFSVVSYTGTGATATVGHGLSSAPEMMIVKNRTNAADWIAYYTTYDGTLDYLRLNTTQAGGNAAESLPTTDVFSVNSGASLGANANNYIAYCFHSVSGYSDFGSYTGTGASGNTVTTGFKPAFVMLKRTDSADDWAMFDSTRGPYAGSTPFLVANSSAVESTYQTLDFDDTGFTLTNTDGKVNGSGATYIYMAFADTREAAFWLDDSGNNNDWENNNLTESDIVLDSPTNNFATLNLLTKSSTGLLLSEGNLRLTRDTASGSIQSTMHFPQTAKYYVEHYIKTISSSSNMYIAVNDSVAGQNIQYRMEGNIYDSSGLVSSAPPTFTTGDIIALTCDAATGDIDFYKNGVSVYSYSGSPLSDAVFRVYNTTSGDSITNFGQDSSFAGSKTPQGNTDANGLGDFYYAPPAGYLALCTSNLPEPAIGPNSATTSDEHFNTVLYTGDGTSSRTISADLSPDLTWIKVRNTTYDHMLIDSVRGTGNYIASSSTNAENWAGNIFPNSTPTTNGFIVDGHLNNSINGSGSTYVAWNWKANGSGVSNTDGSITSTVSANTDAGFSIVSYNSGTAGSQSVGHGLLETPDFIINKNRDASGAWTVWSSEFSNTSQGYMQLNGTVALVNDARIWDNKAPDSSLFYFESGYTHLANDNIISYCFHSVDGFSKFGSYTGNGSTDGPFVYTGFRPAFVMSKRTDAGGSSWAITDNQRSPLNLAQQSLYANVSDAEYTIYDEKDLLSNGFKLRTGSYGNLSGATYIYMAFAEIPVKYSGSMAR